MNKQSAKRSTDIRHRADRSHPRPAPLRPPIALRDRVKELRRVRAGDLQPHPANWRHHPPEQRAALEAALREIGFASALLARELPGGQLQLVDGHLRAATHPEAEVPVLVLDVDEAEAEKLLATFDPLSALARADAAAVAALHERLQTSEAAVEQLLDEVRRAAQANARRRERDVGKSPLELEQLFQVLVECADEATQRRLFERLTSEGYECRALVL